MLTADGVPVLIHDETLRRTTSGRGRVSERTLAEIRTLDAGAWFALEFQGERVLTLDEAVALLLDLGLHANVEIKPAAGHAVATGETVAEILRTAWPKDGSRLLPSSFDRAALAAVRRLRPASRAASWRAGCPRIGARRCRPGAPRCTWTTPARFAALGQLVGEGVPVLYTVNAAARAGTCCRPAPARSSPTRPTC